jgi:YD repeat-containing protein
VAGRGLLGVGLVVGDHPLGGADRLAELVLAEAAGCAEAAQPGPEGLGGGARAPACLSRQTQAGLTTYQFAYTLDGSGKVTQTDLTDPRGNIRRVTFNADGYPLTDTRAFGTALAQTTTYERQAGTNLVTATIDALGRRTEFTYDTKGNVLTVTRLAGTAEAVTTTYTWEPTWNQVASVTDP